MVTITSRDSPGLYALLAFVLVLVVLCTFGESSALSQTERQDRGRSVLPSTPSGQNLRMNRSPRPSQQLSGDTFTIKAGDQLRLEIPGEDWGGQFLVPPSGKLDLRFIGQVEMQGKTLDEIDRILEKRLRDYYQSPDLLINLVSLVPRVSEEVEVKKEFIHMAGAVNQSGRFQIEEPLKFSELMSRRGGFSDRADRKNVRIVRSSGRVLIIDGQKQQDPTNWSEVKPLKIYPGDYIFVPKRGDQGDTQPNVYTMGAVENPGGAVINRPVPLGVAISKTTNGLSGDAVVNQIKITRGNGDTLTVKGEQQLELSEVSPDERIHVRPGDYIFVPGKTTKKREVLVLGRVGSPKHVTVDEGDGVMDALTRAGSLRQNSNRTGIFLFRKADKDTMVRKLSYDRFVQGDFSQNVPVQNNDLIYVPTEFVPRFDTLQSLLQVLGFTSRTINTAENIQDLEELSN